MHTENICVEWLVLIILTRLRTRNFTRCLTKFQYQQMLKSDVGIFSDMLLLLLRDNWAKSPSRKRELRHNSRRPKRAHDCCCTNQGTQDRTHKQKTNAKHTSTDFVRSFVEKCSENRRGRPTKSFLHSLQNDVQKNLQQTLNTSADLEKLRRIAADKQTWIKIFTHSIDLEQFDIS